MIQYYSLIPFTLKLILYRLQKHIHIWLKYNVDTKRNTNHTVQQIFTKWAQLGNHQIAQNSRHPVYYPSSSLPSEGHLCYDSFRHQYFACCWTLHNCNCAYVAFFFLLFCNCSRSIFLQEPKMLLQVAVCIHFYCLVLLQKCGYVCGSVCLYIYHNLLLILLLMDIWVFQFITITDSATMNICVCVLEHICVHFYVKLGAEFWDHRQCQTIFQNSCSNSYCHQWYIRIPLLSKLLQIKFCWNIGIHVNLLFSMASFMLQPQSWIVMTEIYVPCISFLGLPWQMSTN